LHAGAAVFKLVHARIGDEPEEDVGGGRLCRRQYLALCGHRQIRVCTYRGVRAVGGNVGIDIVTIGPKPALGWK
jgi:hypothetical protein